MNALKLLVGALLALALGACSTSVEQAPKPPLADLHVGSYTYSAGGTVELHNVVNRTGRSAALSFQADCHGLPYLPWAATFESPIVTVSPTGGVGYWLERVHGDDPAAYGGPMVCRITAWEKFDEWSVSVGPSAVWLERPAPPEAPAPPLPGTPLKPREGPGVDWP